MGETCNSFSAAQALLLQKKFSAHPPVVGPRKGSSGDITIRRG